MGRSYWLAAVVVAICLFSHSLGAKDASGSQSGGSAREGESEPRLQTIEGRVQVEGERSNEWISRTKVVVDGGKYYGFLKSNGEFEIHNVPAGSSYLVEVVSPNHVFQPARVDISSKSGKIRARKVNLLKTTSVAYLPYPLKFKVEEQAEFFEKREKWNIMDALKNPMMWLLVGPMLIMVVLPKLMKNMDPDYHKEMQDSMSMLTEQQQSMPSLEEMFTNLFGGGGGSSAKAPPKKTKPVSKRPRR